MSDEHNYCDKCDQTFDPSKEHIEDDGNTFKGENLLGDRANVHVKGSYDTNGVFLYTHWSGTELPETVRRALARKQRWGDMPYLTRIIFSEMISEYDEVMGETGYGISSTVGDGEDRIIVIDCRSQMVTLFNGTSMSFDDFVDDREILTK